ncbi:hypothetical protein SNARM312S_07344 [Streptomyces narbonensis]
MARTIAVALAELPPCTARHRLDATCVSCPAALRFSSCAVAAAAVPAHFWIWSADPTVLAAGWRHQSSYTDSVPRLGSVCGVAGVLGVGVNFQLCARVVLQL